MVITPDDSMSIFENNVLHFSAMASLNLASSVSLSASGKTSCSSISSLWDDRSSSSSESVEAMHCT